MQLSTSEILVLFFAITLVILTEMINTAIEQAVVLTFFPVICILLYKGLRR